MSIPVVLAAAPGAARKEYIEALRALGAEVEVFSSPKDVLKAVIASDFQGSFSTRPRSSATSPSTDAS